MSRDLAERSASFLATKLDRRGFLARLAVVGSALTVSPLRFILRPSTAYAAVCGPDASCDSGYTAMCCTVTGTNRCPPGSFTGGWWKADNSGYCCGNSARYYIDCNMQCGQSCGCRCAGGSCDERKVCCVQFRYGQCHQEIACYGPIVCRVVTCTPPWTFDPSCTADLRVDNATAQHSAPCLPGPCSTGIDGHWYALGAERGVLGWPVTAELGTPDGIGRYRHYEGNGSIYWTSGTGAWEVHGGIRGKWSSMGWERSVLGYPVTDESPTADGAGRYNHFQRGSIFWHPSTGAHEVHGAIRGEWSALGWERGVLGYPVTDESPTADGTGRYSHFQRGSIFWHPATGAHEVHGAIRSKWSALSWERGVLGYPVTDESPTADGTGRYSHFQRGSIFWHPATGAHEVHGAIHGKWASLGWERGFLGYPLTDEQAAPGGGGRVSAFQGGNVYWSAATGAHEVHGPILQRYKAEGETGSSLRFPTSDVTNISGGQRCEFEGGAIVWEQASNTTRIVPR